MNFDFGGSYPILESLIVFPSEWTFGNKPIQQPVPENVPVKLAALTTHSITGTLQQNP